MILSVLALTTFYGTFLFLYLTCYYRDELSEDAQRNPINILRYKVARTLAWGCPLVMVVSILHIPIKHGAQ